MLKGENSTPPDVIIYMLEMNNQHRKKLYQTKRGYVKKLPLAAGLFLFVPHLFLCMHPQTFAIVSQLLIRLFRRSLVIYNICCATSVRIGL